MALKRVDIFLPGYGDWEVSQQDTIFRSIPADNIDVRLTKSYMMLPQKSLSWVIGVGKEVITPSEED
ncbi:MAG: hypothetical protein E4G71_04690, partial [Candidatus Atribacteria bacterium]